MKEERYARVCDVTGKGMNEGWCWGDGSFYTATLEDTIKELRSDINDGAYDFDELGKETLLNMSDDELMTYAYDNDVLYWTSWYDELLEEGDTYFDEEGNEHEI
jgi:hypothetical protein